MKNSKCNWEFLSDLDNYIKVKRYRLVNSVVIYEKGELVFERYYNKANENSRNQIKSIWKSIISLTLGICLDKKIIKSIDEPISNYLPQFAQNIHQNHKSITIRHLLTMTSGIYWNGGVHYHCPMMDQMRRSRNWVSHIAEIQTKDFPGTKFVYKEWDVILLSALIGNACKKAKINSVWEMCNEYLYKPLQITSEKWTQSKCGIDYPSWGDDLTDSLCAKDLVKIGLLMLNKGIWKGKRIIKEDYIKAATEKSETSDEYGFLWWLSDKGFHGRGYGGQELNIYPEKNITAVIQATVSQSNKGYSDICENIIL